MFRAQTNAFDDAVLKATDENLTSENWEYILVRSAPHYPQSMPHILLSSVAPPHICNFSPTWSSLPDLG